MLESLQITSWLLSFQGRLVAALVIFLLIWVIKNVAWVKNNILTSDQRKLVANAILSCSPIVFVLLDQHTSAEEAWSLFITTFFGSMGIHSGIKAAVNKEKET